MTAKQMERQARNHYKAWERSEDYTLDFVYGSYSANKAWAWRYCQERQAKLNGYGLKVITHNCMVFTAGFEYMDRDTGEARFYYIAPSFDWDIPITADML